MAEGGHSQSLVSWGVVTAIIVLMCLFLSAATWKETKKTKALLAHVQELSAQCNRPRAPTPALPAEPISATSVHQKIAYAPKQDQVDKNRTYIGANGVALPENLLNTAVVHVEKDLELSRIKLGNRRLLAPSKVSVVNIWATYCKPCKKELPGFKKIFGDHAERWGRNARFIAVKLSEEVAPDDAYARHGSKMPERSYWTSARSEVAGDEVLSALQHPGDNEALLYYGKVPITLVLDCNRRVRWGRFQELKKEHFEELAETVSKLVDELDERKCKRTWCGNGRCERGEDEQSCRRDCGAHEDVTDVESPSETLLDEVPSEQECNRNKDGKCVGELAQGTGRKPKKKKKKTVLEPLVCGDLECERERGENCHTCAMDCQCPTSLQCKQTDLGWKCMAALAK